MKIKFIHLFFISIISNAQTINIKGSVLDSATQKPLEFVSILLKNGENGTLLSYTFSGPDGAFSFKNINPSRLQLSAALLGFESIQKTINPSQEETEVSLTILLKEKVLVLNEVIVRSNQPISVKEDTINIKTKYFTDGTEQTVEDMLKKIPGLQIDAEGTIKVGNQEIEMLMVEGDDFFEKGYKLLSKNMPAYPIEEVQILKRFSKNRLLKGIEQSNKVALNLKLNENAKAVWFGNVKTGLGNSWFRDLSGNLMNFGKKNKYYLLANLNNVGSDATDGVDHLLNPVSLDDIGSIGDNQQILTPLSLSLPTINFKRERYNFNNAGLISANAIFNPTNKVKIKILGFWNVDKTQFFRNSIDFISVGSTSFTNLENYTYGNQQKNIYTQLDLKYEVSNKQLFEASTRFKNGTFNDSTNLIFNEIPTVESLQHQNSAFDQKINYSYKFKERNIAILTSRFKYQSAPQTYGINRFFYEDLFPENVNSTAANQIIGTKMYYFGVDAHVLSRKKDGSLLELQIGNEIRSDLLKSTFSLNQEDDKVILPEGYQNQLHYRVNDFYAKSKYRLAFEKIGLTGFLELHQLFNEWMNDKEIKRQNPFFINPGVSFDWKIHENHSIISSYTFNTSNVGILDIFDSYILTGYRSFSKGTGNFNQLNSRSIIVNYQVGKWGNRFFANTFILYNKNHDFLSTNSFLTPNYTLTDKIIIKDRKLLSANSTIDYFMEPISTNIKLDIGYMQSEYKNIVNNSFLRNVTSFNYYYGSELRSGFDSFFNFHIGSKWTTTLIKTDISNTFTDRFSFLDLVFIINPKVDFQLQSERYFFGNLETDNVYYFLDFDANYKLIENKITIGISARNLLNTDRFSNFSVSDIGYSVTEQKLLPRILLVKAEVRL